jgi:hypothetical protein
MFDEERIRQGYEMSFVSALPYTTLNNPGHDSKAMNAHHDAHGGGQSHPPKPSVHCFHNGEVQRVSLAEKRDKPHGGPKSLDPASLRDLSLICRSEFGQPERSIQRDIP